MYEIPVIVKDPVVKGTHSFVDARSEHSLKMPVVVKDSSVEDAHSLVERSGSNKSKKVV